jgi:2-succinyl-6-hydroxy-2,4-cyclohexadiene-1-carboxylate synthase
MAAWNAQSVFAQGVKEPLRREDDFCRERLGLALNHWSVALQPDLRPALLKEKRPILWLAGERDAKYVALAQKMGRLNRMVSPRIISEAGHRLPWEAPAAFIQALASLLRTPR